MALGLRKRVEIDRLEQIWRSYSRNTATAFFAPDAATGGTPCLELECLRGLIADAALENAARRAAMVGTGADRVLIGTGEVDEEFFLRRFAEKFGLAFDDLERIGRDQCPLADDRLVDAAATGIIPILDSGELIFVVAPRGTAMRRIAELALTHPDTIARIRLTTSEYLNNCIFTQAGEALGRRAADDLRCTNPVMSAAPPRWRNSIWLAIAMGGLAFAAFLLRPQAAMIALEAALGIVFLGWIALRLVGIIIEHPIAPARRSMPDARLPVYTILIALYREAASVGSLLKAVEDLDYPPEKLDVKIIVEADDGETQEALSKVRPPFPLEIIVAPETGPRTKPKALNAALPFARGSFLVIYDAEDRPASDQLRRALDCFLSDDSTLACVQASLTIDNTADNWLTALFTAEYAGQFDVFLPALTALQLPLPLGGSSNHFRTAVLREIGGWDPYNVTEDADLGMRIARYGYRSGIIASPTYEEAPVRFGPWLRQRTRWFKGWMQTWLVHMREPRRLARDLGLPGFIAFQLMVGGNVLAALVHPLFLLGFAVSILGGIESQAIVAALFGLSFVVGYVTSALLGLFGLLRRGPIAAAWVLPLIPVHWLMLSIAAWRAVFHLILDPYRWEKTDHGLARTSRLERRKRARRIVAQILGDAGVEAGSPLSRSSAAVPPRHRRAAA